MPNKAVDKKYIRSNGDSLREVVIKVYAELCKQAGMRERNNSRAIVKLSLTEVFASCGYSESDRIVVTWVMYYHGLFKKLNKQGAVYNYEIYAVDVERAVTEESINVAIEEYTTYKRSSKKRRREAVAPECAVGEVSVVASTPLSPALAEQIASLMVELEEKSAALAVANKRIADLEDLVTTLKEAPKQSVEDQLAAAIEKLRTKK